jgi:transposase InsO family protein
VAALIAAQRAKDGIPYAVSCRALGVSRSWFYRWKAARPGPRAQRRDRLKAEVMRLFAEHEGKYGSPRIAADLRDAGWRVSENTVAALMRELGLAARRKKKRKGTTRPGKGRWRAPDLVKQDFPAAKINCKWYGDGTEIPTVEKMTPDKAVEALSKYGGTILKTSLSKTTSRNSGTHCTAAQLSARLASGGRAGGGPPTACNQSRLRRPRTRRGERSGPGAPAGHAWSSLRRRS